jgi:hypothetical protein
VLFKRGIPTVRARDSKVALAVPLKQNLSFKLPFYSLKIFPVDILNVRHGLTEGSTRNPQLCYNSVPSFITIVPDIAEKGPRRY